MNRTEFIDMCFNDLEIYGREYLKDYSITADVFLEKLRECWKESRNTAIKEIINKLNGDLEQ